MRLTCVHISCARTHEYTYIHTCHAQVERDYYQREEKKGYLWCYTVCFKIRSAGRKDTAPLRRMRLLLKGLALFWVLSRIEVPCILSLFTLRRWGYKQMNSLRFGDWTRSWIVDKLSSNRWIFSPPSVSLFNGAASFISRCSWIRVSGIIKYTRRWREHA